MVVENLQNIPNPHMHYGKNNIVGVIDVPKLPPKSSADTKELSQKTFAQAHNDVFEKYNKAPTPKKSGIPLIIKITAGIATGVSLILFPKQIGRGILNFIKNIPK